jgi:hypothetical protein
MMRRKELHEAADRIWLAIEKELGPNAMVQWCAVFGDMDGPAVILSNGDPGATEDLLASGIVKIQHDRRAGRGHRPGRA